MTKADFGRTASDYARWRDPVPTWVYDLMEERGALHRGVPVLDLACGTGEACREMAARGAVVTGVDVSEAMIREARKRDDLSTYLVSPAEALPLENRSVRLVTVMRAWHWFDRQRVIAEIRRVLEPGGWLVVVDTHFERSPLVDETLDVISRYNPAAKRPPGSRAETHARRYGFPAPWFREWEDSGFTLVHHWERTYPVSFTHESWRGRVRALSSVVDLPEETMQALDQDLHDLLMNKFRNQPIEVPHACIGLMLRHESI